MINWSFAASLMVMLAGIGVVVLAAWLGWGNWQRNGRRGRVALLESLRLVAVAMLAFTLLQPEFVRQIERTETPQVTCDDGIDNDCDGTTDNRIAARPSQCGDGACIANGEITCANGNEIDSCQPGEPGAEVCDGVDNDCDGPADERLVVQPSSCGVGACASQGVISCEEGIEVDTCRAVSYTHLTLPTILLV